MRIYLHCPAGPFAPNPKLISYQPSASGCVRSEYGDLFDTMGNGFHHFTVAYKEFLGWLEPVSVTTSGVYEIGPLENAGSPVKALKNDGPDHDQVYWQPMALWRKFVRLVAIAIVLGTVADLGVDLYGAARSTQDKSSRSTPPCDNGASREDCFCCCSHVAVPNQITLAVVLIESEAGKMVLPATPFIASDPPFHPPKT